MSNRQRPDVGVRALPRTTRGIGVVPWFERGPTPATNRQKHALWSTETVVHPKKSSHRFFNDPVFLPLHRLPWGLSSILRNPAL